MNVKTKEMYFIITYGIVLFAALINFEKTVSMANTIITIVSPVFLGMIFAFVLYVPITAIERRLNRFFFSRKFKPNKKMIERLSLFVVIFLIGVLITTAITLAVPELIRSLKRQGMNLPFLSELSEFLNLSKIYSYFQSIGSSFIRATSSTITGAANIIFAFIIGIYILLSKDNLKRQIRLLMKAHLKKDIEDKIIKVFSLIQDRYRKF